MLKIPSKILQAYNTHDCDAYPTIAPAENKMNPL